MSSISVPLLVVLLLSLLEWSHAFSPSSLTSSVLAKALHRRNAYVVTGAVQRDAQGYEIKPRDWFNGLSLDPGASLTDPRAVPPECRTFAENVKSNSIQPSLAETLALIDKHYNYFEVPFTCGSINNPAKVNIGAAKIFSFALMTRMNEEQTLRLFGEVYRNLSANGDDHQNVRSFIKCGWSGVTFSSGLAIISKLQAYDDTESALATQATIEGSAEWDVNSDSWIP